MPGRAIMVVGTTSGAGKSWLATALCRFYARRGLRVAPFKAQNMSNNARVVPDPQGRMGEIGSAQYFQALAARARPDVRMNPILLKPESDTSSQVIVLGQVRAELGRVPWRERSERLWPHAREALHTLLDENDLVVIEGAGSPAEINLRHSDFVNMRTAREAGAACLLVTDIDRGGAFAHLFGTHQLLPVEDRGLLRGFVLNRFRGDAALLAPGPEQLERLTGVPTLAVLPLWRGHGLPEEDGAYEETAGGGPGAGVRVAIVGFPRISNLDEFQPLRDCARVRLRWARTAAELEDVDWIILPGSKSTSADRAWMRGQGLDTPILRHAARGGAILGLCGGLQMLGGRMSDPHGLDGDEQGLGLLPLETRFEREKLLRQAHLRFGDVTGAWRVLAAVELEGYEIHQGRTVQVAADGGSGARNAGDEQQLPEPWEGSGPPAMEPSRQAVSSPTRWSGSGATTVALRNDDGEAIGWQRGNVLGLYAHGLFESPAVMRALFGSAPRTLESVFDGLADFVDRHFQPGALARLAGLT